MALLIGQACSNESIEKQWLENDKSCMPKLSRTRTNKKRRLQNENSYGTCPFK